MSRLASLESRVLKLERSVGALQGLVEGLVRQLESSPKLEKKASQKKPQEVGEDE